MNSWTLNPETERIRKERNAEADRTSRKRRALGIGGLVAGDRQRDAREGSSLATQDGNGGTPSPVSQAEHAYHEWQRHFWGARERTFNRLGIRER